VQTRDPEPMTKDSHEAQRLRHSDATGRGAKGVFDQSIETRELRSIRPLPTPSSLESTLLTPRQAG